MPTPNGDYNKIFPYILISAVGLAFMAGLVNSCIISRIKNQDDELNLAFYEAVKERLPGDSLDNIKSFLDKGVVVNPKWSNADGYPPFLVAVSNEDISLVNLLLEYGADVNAVFVSPSGSELNALTLAIHSGNVGLLKTLIKAGVDVNSYLKIKDTSLPVLWIALLEAPNPQIVVELLESGADYTLNLGSSNILSRAADIMVSEMDVPKYVVHNLSELFIFVNAKKTERENNNLIEL